MVTFMSEQFDNIDTLIVRSLENSLSPVEQTMLQAWLNEDAAHRRYFDEIRRTWTVTGENDLSYTPDTDANWQRFKQRMYIDGDTPALKVVRNNTRYYRIAASVAGIALAGILYFTLRGPHEIVTLTAANEKKTLTLPDGSKVYMNQHSSVRYDKQLAGAERAVHLEGEAFFEVATQPGRPFVVYTSQTQTQVLGTSFDVRAYAATPVEVAVVTGKVAVSLKHESAAKKLILTPGRKATFGIGQQPEERANNDLNFIAWKENRFLFDQTSIHDVVKTLESYYGVKISVADKAIDSMHLVRRFDQIPPLPKVLDAIAELTNLNWAPDGDGYRIYRK
jgi:ferric-dicitrate binding protein FerR (iron transport regulator)